eukprot:1160090-Pelagomonas_calceolata.AAC.16
MEISQAMQVEVAARFNPLPHLHHIGLTTGTFQSFLGLGQKACRQWIFPPRATLCQHGVMVVTSSASMETCDGFQGSCT